MDGIPSDLNIYPDKYYDPFFARRIPGIIRSCGLSNIKLISKSFSFTYPVSQKERMYISENGSMITKFLDSSEYGEEIVAWQKQFKSDNSDCIFDNPNFIYTMTEFVFMCGRH